MLTSLRCSVDVWRRRFEQQAAKLDSVDVLVFGGLVLMGAGLWRQFGWGWALILVGFALALIGWFGR